MEQLPPIKPKYQFRIVEGYKTNEGTYKVQVRTTNYNYGEDAADYGWMDAYEHPQLKGWFSIYYYSIDRAKLAVHLYRKRQREIVFWEEPEEEQKDENYDT